MIAAVLVVPLLAAGCSSYGGTTSSSNSSASVDCRHTFERALALERQGVTSQDLLDRVESMYRSCPAEYKAYTDYIEIVLDTVEQGVQSCDHWRNPEIGDEPVRLLREDGLCSDEPVAPPKPTWPDGGLGWDEARSHAGSWQRVCGPLKSVRVLDYGVFVNIGLDYPSADRFTFVIWGDWQLEPIPASSTICASGNIYLHEEVVTQIELGHPNEIEIWD
ncbi:hypothetical protein AB0O87_09380 [Microbacterium sp. NPDC076768]|uniref:hypothetical protein n=1 Tax=Microbacterium sp. NPDC076768 TaxID=3154858 RepID=UPI003440C4A8